MTHRQRLRKRRRFIRALARRGTFWIDQATDAEIKLRDGNLKWQRRVNRAVVDAMAFLGWFR